MNLVRQIACSASIALLAAACSPGSEEANEAAQMNGQSQAVANAIADDPNNPFREAEAQMHERMMAATGADPSETWILSMIEHHRGALAMSDIVLAQNPTTEVREEALRLRKERTEEIATLERMLRTAQAAAQSAPAAAPAPASTAAPRPTGSEPALPKAETKPAPKPAPKTPPPAADPHAGHDMNTMNTN